VFNRPEIEFKRLLTLQDILSPIFCLNLSNGILNDYNMIQKTTISNLPRKADLTLILLEALKDIAQTSNIDYKELLNLKIKQIDEEILNSNAKKYRRKRLSQALKKIGAKKETKFNLDSKLRKALKNTISEVNYLS
jgi:hypothetical protein